MSNDIKQALQNIEQLLFKLTARVDNIEKRVGYDNSRKPIVPIDTDDKLEKIRLANRILLDALECTLKPTPE